MNQETKILLWSLGLFVLFVTLPIIEIWILKRMGFDILARLQLTLKQGKAVRFFVEGFGAVAFILAQPFFFLWLFANISTRVEEILKQSFGILVK